MEVERLSTNKLNKLNEIEKLEKYIDDAPLIHENIIINKKNTYKRAIADKSNDSLRQVLRILFKRILVSLDSIDLVINLNAFLNTESQKNLEMIISESRENIEKLDKKIQDKYILVIYKN